jgi:hypothetical protein
MDIQTAGQIETDGQKFRGTKEQTDRHTDRQRDTVFCMNISLFVLYENIFIFLKFLKFFWKF